MAQVAPTGFTAVIDHQGKVLERSSISEREVVQREVRLREGLTLCTRLGNGPAPVSAVLVVAAGWALQLTGRGTGGWQHRRSGPQPPASEGPR